ncbi:MAG TPA: VWA domain-containing protein, partial [Anaerolineae bacterium]|nr:VWA domain-containing protein [Anaerolineae bacterium]
MSNHPACRSLRRCLLAGLMVLLLVALTAPASGQSRSYIPDLDIVLVIDESGSLWELNDPPDSNTGNPGWRIVMANMFGDLLGVDQSGAQHRLAIVTFGTEAKLAQPLTAIQNQRSRDEIKQSLAKAHTNMGWTAIPKALDVALDELEARGRTGANAKQAIVFLSDGRCELHESMTKAETALCNQEARLLMERAQAAHCPIYTIAFTSAAFKSDAGNEIYKNLWQEIANTTQGLYFEPERPETGLLDAYTNIIRHLFGLSGQDVPPPVEAPIELTYEARPNLLQVIFTIIKYNKDITTTIIRPDGSVVRSGDPGVEISSSAQTDSYSIMRPPAGRWTVRLSGSGKVTFVDIPIPITARVEPLAPGATHPLGKPMDIVARVVDAEMVPQQLSDLTLVIKAPGGATVAVPIARDGEFYRARLEDTSARGTYVLTYNGEHKGAPVEYEQSVNVVAAPWLKLTEPAPGKSYPFDQVPVKAQLMLGTQPSPADPQDRLECVAQVVPEGGRAWEAPLVAGRDGLFSGVVKGERPGTYPLRVQLTL